MFDLGIINDEVSDDFARTCELVRAWGLSHVELRVLWGKNVLQLNENEVTQAVALLREHDLTVTAIASPVFKSPLDEKLREQEADFALEGVEGMEAQLELLERACALAGRFGTGMVRIFTFWREPWSETLAQEVVEKLGRGAEVAQRHGVVLAIENEPVCIAGTGQELGALCRTIATGLPTGLTEHLGALWDPGNALAGGEQVPYPDGYRSLRGCQLIHVHLKDLTFDETGSPMFVPLGEGRIDFRGQLEQLQRDGYRGVLVLEPHYRPEGILREEAARTCVEAAQQMLNDLASAARE